MECFFCGAPCTEDDYCEGCEVYLCRYCGTPEEGLVHRPEDHLVPEELWDDGYRYLQV